MHARKQLHQLGKLQTHKQSLQQPPCSSSSLPCPHPCSSPTPPAPAILARASSTHARQPGHTKGPRTAAGTTPCRPRCVPRTARYTRHHAVPPHATPPPRYSLARRPCCLVARTASASATSSALCVLTPSYCTTRPSPLLLLPSVPIKGRGRAELCH
jgi:hypothetical protein